ncbi:MAG: hypothetical protein GY909_17340 [Oligoflexia bacterium]|nr:hypothetical protein [Bacteroidota bacterium]MCP4914887.1 hypothetical protein [Oligoflexia bacterium]
MSLDKLVSFVLVSFSFLMSTHLYQFEQESIKNKELEIKYFIGSVVKEKKIEVNDSLQYSREVFNSNRRSIQ